MNRKTGCGNGCWFLAGCDHYNGPKSDPKKSKYL